MKDHQAIEISEKLSLVLGKEIEKLGLKEEDDPIASTMTVITIFSALYISTYSQFTGLSIDECINRLTKSVKKFLEKVEANNSEPEKDLH